MQSLKSSYGMTKPARSKVGPSLSPALEEPEKMTLLSFGIILAIVISLALPGRIHINMTFENLLEKKIQENKNNRTTYKQYQQL